MGRPIYLENEGYVKRKALKNQFFLFKFDGNLNAVKERKEEIK